MKRFDICIKLPSEKYEEGIFIQEKKIKKLIRFIKRKVKKIFVVSLIIELEKNENINDVMNIISRIKEADGYRVRRRYE